MNNPVANLPEERILNFVDDKPSAKKTGAWEIEHGFVGYLDMLGNWYVERD